MADFYDDHYSTVLMHVTISASIKMSQLIMTMTADDYDQQITIEHEPIVTKGSAASPLIGKERFRGFSCSYGPSLNVH